MIFALVAALASPVRDSQPAHLVDDAQHLITLLNSGHADSVQSRMTADAQALHTAAQRDSIWHVIVNQVGAFQRFGRSQVKSGQAGERTVDMEVIFARRPAEALITYAADGRVSSVSFSFNAGS